jgi:hypothetical protein
MTYLEFLPNLRFGVALLLLFTVKNVIYLFFFFFFLHVHIKRGKMIRISDFYFMRHNSQPIELHFKIFELVIFAL